MLNKNVPEEVVSKNVFQESQVRVSQKKCQTRVPECFRRVIGMKCQVRLPRKTLLEERKIGMSQRESNKSVIQEL